MKNNTRSGVLRQTWRPYRVWASKLASNQKIFKKYKIRRVPNCQSLKEGIYLIN